MSFSRQARQGHNILRPLGFLITIALISTILGCATKDFNQMRSNHAEEFPAELAQKTQDLVKIAEPLDLDACINIAMGNRQAEKGTHVTPSHLRPAFRTMVCRPNLPL